MGKDYIDFIKGIGGGRPVVDLTQRDPRFEYQTFVTVGGTVLDIPTVQKTGGIRYACELFFCNMDENRFGVRFTDGSEEMVENTERNRELYSAMIEYYREKMEALNPWRE